MSTETVRINGLTLCHKKATGFVRSTLPDVCKAPSMPVPFVNIAFARDLAKGTSTVRSHDGAMCGIKGSEFSISYGDEPGTGGGVKSGVNGDRATFLSWSPDVFMEGRPVTRLTDRMLMNQGNTISAAGYFTGPVTGASKTTLDLLCDIACRCLASGQHQTCVAAAISGLPRTPTDGLYAEVTFSNAGVMYRNPDQSPQTRYGVPGSRLDLTSVAAGQPVEFIEMKFPGDRLRGTQQRRYSQIARMNGKQLQMMNIPQDCNNCEGLRQTNQPDAAPQTDPNLGWWLLGAAGVVAAGACIYFSAGICGLVLGGAGATAAAGT
ncbi:PAAR-like domain-containing protein [Paracoccus sp. Ld10]|uniref:PAAR-like domain-containing protein n=1 Tax=Paracoccus sp. Ld10 TaxID=649158 RepID=UPI00386EEE74